jgi:hypothetical protein
VISTFFCFRFALEKKEEKKLGKRGEKFLQKIQKETGRPSVSEVLLVVKGFLVVVIVFLFECNHGVASADPIS